MSILLHFNEGHEKIQDAVAQLLHVRMLIGRALVAVNRNALVHNLSIKVPFFSQRFHHQLLQIFAEQRQPVLVG